MARSGIFTDRDILERMRAEFDYLFDRHRTDADYAALLELTIMNRLDEAGIAPKSQGTDGVAGWKRDRDDTSACSSDGRHHMVCSACNSASVGFVGKYIVCRDCGHRVLGIA